MRSRAKKVVTGVSIVVVLLIVVSFGLRFGTEGGRGKIAVPPPFIVANPLDLSQVKTISQYRSCIGHDYSDTNIQLEEEPISSMKHYIEPINELAQKPNQVVVKAPFDGTITSIIRERAGQEDYQVWLSLNTDRKWKFVYFHINLLSHLKKGSEIGAGQPIGYARFDGEAANFDIALKRVGFPSPPVLESPFLYMVPKVLAEYAARGITPDNIIIPKAERETNACPTIPTDRRDTDFPPGTGEEARIHLN